MEVPSPAAGKVTDIKVAVGDKVAEGSVILTLEGAESAGRRQAGDGRARRGTAAPTAPEAPRRRRSRRRRQGPGRRARRRPGRLHGGVPRGRPRAVRRADRPRRAARRRLPERRLHPVQGAAARRQGDDRGRASWARPASPSSKPKIDVDKVREWKNGVVGRLTGGLESLAKQRKVQVVRGTGEFTGPNTIAVGDTVVGFEHCIIAAGSEAASLPFLPEDDADHGLHRRARGRRRSRSGCWSSAAASSASRWRRSTTRSARRSPSSSCSTS